ncbi:hypothetical protein EKD04_007705 [Chloroflexales bacterium ZM16-3]|nr:hypothetical protein [Chloroflexales bacterium ZM16-3]
MELLIALILFIAIVASWIVLPGSPDEKSTGHSVATAAVSKVGVTA